MNYHAHTAETPDGLPLPEGSGLWLCSQDERPDSLLRSGETSVAWEAAEGIRAVEGPPGRASGRARASQRGRRPEEVLRSDFQPVSGQVSSSAFSNVGPFRPGMRVCETENHERPTMLKMVFDQTSIFSQN